MELFEPFVFTLQEEVGINGIINRQLGVRETDRLATTGFGPYLQIVLNALRKLTGQAPLKVVSLLDRHSFRPNQV
jgi:hypothetical protein